MIKSKISLSDAIVFSGIAVLSIFMIDMIYNFISIPAFRHDELKYIYSYDGKLSSEGRWLNYLFFNSLRYINIKIAACFGLVCFFIFSYRCVEMLLEKKYAFLIALLCLFMPPIHLLNEWAQTTFLSFIVLMVASLTYNCIHKFLFFVIFGVLFNGVLSHFYFLLPLLFLGDKKIDKYTIIYWIIGFIVGFCIAQMMTWALCGDFIRLESWRQPNYIHGFEDVIINIKRAYFDMVHNYKFFGRTALCLLPISIVVIFYEIYQKKLSLIQVVVLLLVSGSIFALAVPAGVFTSTRSTACLFMATIMIFVFAFRKIKIILMVFSVFLSSYFYTHNMQNITYVKTVMTSWMKDLSSIPVVSESIRGIVVLSENKDFGRMVSEIQKNTHTGPRSTEGLGMVMRWRPAAIELGYKNVIYGTGAKKLASRHVVEEKLKQAPYKETSYYRYTVIDDYLFLSVK